MSNVYYKNWYRYKGKEFVPAKTRIIGRSTEVYSSELAAWVSAGDLQYVRPI